MGDAFRSSEAKALLKKYAAVQTTDIMGWGMPNPMPSPGKEHFAELDKRVALMVETAQRPVIALCCAPDWMKGGIPGSTDWSALEKAPLKEHFDDFADLAARIAKRYPKVKHFLVWNELKGFWNSQTQRWNIEAYTDLYNRVWRAVKAVRPDAQIGGPYVVMVSYRQRTPAAKFFGSELHGAWGTVDFRSLEAIDYWLEHSSGADFVAVDGSIAPREGGLDVPLDVGLQKFEAVNNWLRARTRLPIWWAEIYPVPPHLEGEGAERAAASAVRWLRATSVAEVLIFWDPACNEQVSYGRGVCLWSPPSTSRQHTLDASPLVRQELQFRQENRDDR